VAERRQVKLGPAIVAIRELKRYRLSTHEIVHLVNREFPPRNVFHRRISRASMRRVLKSIPEQAFEEATTSQK
jgi:hypothetical protein